MRAPKPGDKVRVTFEGTYQKADDSWGGPPHKIVVDGNCTLKTFLSSAKSIEVLQPEVRIGQVWKAGKTLFVYRSYNSIPKFYTMEATYDTLQHSAETFFRLYPEAELIFSPE
jgi:hypothetical protein